MQIVTDHTQSMALVKITIAKLGWYTNFCMEISRIQLQLQLQVSAAGVVQKTRSRGAN